MILKQTVAALGVAAMLSACASSFKDPGSIGQHARGAQPRFDPSVPPMQCVPYARKKSGVKIFGDAYTWWGKAASLYETDDEPQKGSVMVIKGYQNEERAHVAVVRKILGDREITVDHANWGNDLKTQLDTPVMDVSRSNDWSRVRVWHMDSQRYGGRVYEVSGFIGPDARSSRGLLW